MFLANFKLEVFSMFVPSMSECPLYHVSIDEPKLIVPQVSQVPKSQALRELHAVV